MIASRAFIHTVFLFLLPVIVAWFGWSVPTAILAIVIMLLWRWMLSILSFALPEKVPELVLESISASHFVEKVRWNMDAAGIDYTERAAGGTLGAFFAGRTVPRLQVKTGAVRSQIGNSPEILRYLWGRYATELGNAAKHLEPTPERLEFERSLDRYGRSLQVWIYHHLLNDRELTLRAWGANSPMVPLWQRWALQLFFPVLAFLIRRTFRITPENYEKACHRIEELLGDIDLKLADGRRSILNDDELNFTDYTFAAFTGLWLQPQAYGGGKAHDVRIERSRTSNAMRADIERWIEDYPKAIAWVQELYATSRGVKAQGPDDIEDAMVAEPE